MSSPTEHKTVQARILAYAQDIGWTLVSREEAEQRRGSDPQMSCSESPASHLRSSAKSADKNSSAESFGNLKHPDLPQEPSDLRRGSDPQIAQIFTDSESPAIHLRSSAKSADKNSSADGKGLSLFFDDLLDSKVREFNPRYAEAEGALLGQLRHLHTDIYGNREFLDYLRNRGKFYDHEEKRERDLILIDYEHPEHNTYEVTEEWAYHNGHYGTREDVVFLINGIPALVIECKNANKDEAIALGVDQIRRYHRETPELFVSQQLFTATDAIGFSYGVSWNTVRRNIFNWKLSHPQMTDSESPASHLRSSAKSADKNSSADSFGSLPQEPSDLRRGSDPQITQIFTDSESTAPNLRSSAKSADKNSADSFDSISHPDLPQEPSDLRRGSDPQITQIFTDSESPAANLRSSARSADKISADNLLDIPGRLETKVKTFCAITHLLSVLKDYIVFAEKDEELNKYILRQHQTGAVEATVTRALDPKRTRDHPQKVCLER
jgi:hypothetical protein